jgi:hypothetical protein
MDGHRREGVGEGILLLEIDWTGWGQTTQHETNLTTYIIWDIPSEEELPDGSARGLCLIRLKGAAYVPAELRMPEAYLECGSVRYTLVAELCFNLVAIVCHG